MDNPTSPDADKELDNIIGVLLERYDLADHEDIDNVIDEAKRDLLALIDAARKEAAFREIKIAVKAGAVSDRYAATRVAWLEAEQPAPVHKSDKE